MGELTVSDMLQITLVRSPIGYPEKQRRVLRALGLGKMNSSVIQADQPSVRGMIKHVQHLVAVTPGISGGAAGPARSKPGAEKGEKQE